MARFYCVVRFTVIIQVCGYGVFIFFSVIALISPFWTLGNPYAMDLANTSALPSLGHGLANILGTDLYGRSILPRLMVAVSNSFQVIFAGMILGFPLGTGLGLWYGSKNNSSLVSNFFDFLTGVPILIFAMLLIAFTGGGKWSVILIIALSMCTIFFRIGYLGSKRICTMPFVKASFMMRRTRFFVVKKHVFPNLKHNLFAQICPQIITCLVIESGINYLGLGLPLEIPSLGGIIYEGQYLLFVSFGEGIVAVITLLLLSVSLGIIYQNHS